MAIKLATLEEVVDQKVYIPLLKAWFWRELGKVYSAPAASDHGVLMGCPLWGDDFIDRFAFFCLPSIKAAKNLEAIKGRCRLVLFTDEPGFVRLFQLARAIEKIGIAVQVHVIPQVIMEHLPKSPLNKYWLLGTIQNLLVQMAGRAGMGFHMLQPDHLYAHAYFLNMFRLAADYDGIAQTSISGDVAVCLPELEQWRAPDGSLEIPDRELGDMAFRHLHKQSQVSMMNGADLTKDLPDSHFLFWVGRDKLHLFCCHMNAAWLSPAVCQRAPVRLHNALDTELPAFMPENVCIPGADDGMTFVELSDDTKLHSVDRVNFPDFALRCWATVHFGLNHMPFFEAVCEVPIKEQAAFADEEAIAKTHSTLIAGLLTARKPIMDAVEEHRRAAEIAGQEGMAEDLDASDNRTDGEVRLRERHPVELAAAKRERRQARNAERAAAD